MLVTAGLNHLAAYLDTQNYMQYCAIGTDSTTPVAGNTALVAEVGTRVASTLTSASNVVTWTAQFAAANPATEQTIKEWGLFSASTSGTMLLREVDTTGYTKAATDTINIIFEITVS